MPYLDQNLQDHLRIILFCPSNLDWRYCCHPASIVNLLRLEIREEVAECNRSK